MADLTPEPIDPVRWAEGVAQTWFLDDDGHDRLRLVDGVEGGWDFHVEAFNLLVRFAEQRSGRSSGRSGPGAVAKRLGIDRGLRAWGLRALATARPHTRDGGAIALIGEVPTPSMTDPLIAVASALGDDAVVWSADPRVHRRFQRAGLRPDALVTSLERERRLVRSSRRAVAARIDDIRDSPPVIRLGERDVSREVVQLLTRVAARALPWAAVERAAIADRIHRSGVRCVVLASDQHPIGRLAVTAAHEANVATVVVQHGLPRIRIGLVPVIADRIAAWSANSAAWLADRGTSAHRIVITGNVRVDAAVGMSRRDARESVDRGVGLSGSPRLLLALSPDAGIAVNQWLVDTTLELVAALSDAALIVKLHPGQTDASFVRSRIASRGVRARVRVLRREPIEPLLAWADATFLYRSSVAVESLVQGTPVVLLMPPDSEHASPPELSALRLPTAASAGVAADLLRLLMTPSGREAHLAERMQPLEQAVGPLDGQSSRRVADLCRALAAGEAR